jgi:hypothetical protein
MRIPIPLLFAAVVAAGAVVTILIQVNIKVLGSWDSRYAAFNGTHIYQTGPMINTPHKTLYLGYGTAYFQNPTNVYYLRKVKSDATGGNADLGGYLPIRVVVESGSLPTNTYIEWRDPYGGATRKLYFVAGANRGYVLGTFRARTGAIVNVAIPIYYVVEDSRSQVRIYPMERAAVNTGEACSVVRNAGLGGAYNFIYAILDRRSYDCAFGTWSTSTDVDWAQVASSVTTASLYPSPTYYRVTVTVGSSTLSLYLSYWYTVDSDPGFFSVKPG